MLASGGDVLVCCVRRIAPLVIASIIGAAGCTTLKIADIPVQTAGGLRYGGQQGAVKDAVHPFTGPTESDRYFGTVLLDHNVLAILVVAENRSASSSYLLTREQRGLCVRQATDRVAAPVSPEAGPAVALAGVILLSPPTLM